MSMNEFPICGFAVRISNELLNRYLDDSKFVCVGFGEKATDFLRSITDTNSIIEMLRDSYCLIKTSDDDFFDMTCVKCDTSSGELSTDELEDEMCIMLDYKQSLYMSPFAAPWDIERSLEKALPYLPKDYDWSNDIVWIKGIIFN